MQQAVCVRRKRKREKKSRRSRLTDNTPRDPQPPGDRDQLETARGETRPTLLPTIARFQISRVCGIGLVQLSQSVKTTNVIHT